MSTMRWEVGSEPWRTALRAEVASRVAAMMEAYDARRERRRRVRAELDERRKYGLEARHRAKLAHFAAQSGALENGVARVAQGSRDPAGQAPAVREVAAGFIAGVESPRRAGAGVSVASDSGDGEPAARAAAMAGVDVSVASDSADCEPVACAAGTAVVDVSVASDSADDEPAARAAAMVVVDVSVASNSGDAEPPARAAAMAGVDVSVASDSGDVGPAARAATAGVDVPCAIALDKGTGAASVLGRSAPADVVSREADDGSPAASTAITERIRAGARSRTLPYAIWLRRHHRTLDRRHGDEQLCRVNPGPRGPPVLAWQPGWRRQGVRHSRLDLTGTTLSLRGSPQRQARPSSCVRTGDGVAQMRMSPLAGDTG